MNKKYLLIAIALVITTAGIFSCGKDNENSTLRVRLTDNPTAFQEVNVDIREVRVKFTDDPAESDWITLATTVGVYDLLKLQGIDTALAAGLVPSNTVKQIRLVLGPNNTIKDAGIVYPLTIPSGSESGLKINIDKPLNETIETLLIDFDAALSVKKEGTGDYKLRPVLKIK